MVNSRRDEGHEYPEHRRPGRYYGVPVIVDGTNVDVQGFDDGRKSTPRNLTPIGRKLTAGGARRWATAFLAPEYRMEYEKM
jgi:hypothetical protein